MLLRRLALEASAAGLDAETASAALLRRGEGRTVLVVGGGGREHAIVWKLAQSADVARVLDLLRYRSDRTRTEILVRLQTMAARPFQNSSHVAAGATTCSDEYLPYVRELTQDVRLRRTRQRGGMPRRRIRHRLERHQRNLHRPSRHRSQNVPRQARSGHGHPG